MYGSNIYETSFGGVNKSIKMKIVLKNRAKILCNSEYIRLVEIPSFIEIS